MVDSNGNYAAQCDPLCDSSSVGDNMHVTRPRFQIVVGGSWMLRSLINKWNLIGGSWN